MTRRYIDEPLTDLDDPEPIRTPRTCTPRYIEISPETPPPRQQIPDAAYGLPAYQSTLPGRPRSRLSGPLPVWPRPAPPAVPDVDPAQLRQAFIQWAESLRPGLTKLGDDLHRIFAQLAPATQQLAPATQQLAPAQILDDPRARALWLRQHRNTGPTRDLTRQRRPRQHPGGPR